MSLHESYFRRIPLYFKNTPQNKQVIPTIKYLKLNEKINLELSDKFQKSLGKLANKNQWVSKAWAKVVMQLASQEYNSKNFQKWEKGGKDVFSIRVCDRSPAYRAHIKKQGNNQPWLALDIGDHKSMGHG